MSVYQQVKQIKYKFSFLEEGLTLDELYSLNPGQKILISSISGFKLISHPCLFEDISNSIFKTYYYFPPIHLSDFTNKESIGSYYIPEYNDIWSVKYPTREISKLQW